jgi:hypothetical protein
MPYFKASGIPKDLGVDLERTLIHALFTDNDAAINFQDPHTDYPYCITRRNLKEKIRYSWTGHMPILPDRSWITLWFGLGEGYTLHILHGEILLLRSDIIHGGGIPNVDSLTALKQFRRLHFYLVTPDQPANPGETYDLYYDNETKLTDMYFQSKRSFR